MKVWLVVIVILAAAAGGGVWYWKANANDAPEYKTAEVSRGNLVQSVTATGQINPVTNVTVGSQVSGIISKMYADYNSPVTNGQLIAEIDPATYTAIVAQGQGDLASAQAARDLAKAEADRADALFNKNYLAKSDYDQAIATLHQSEAMVSIKKASLDQAKANLAYTKIYAPINGIVLSRNVDVGQTVAASFSAPTLFVIANDLAQMQIDALVSEADIGGIKTNEAVNFTVDAFPTRNFRGVVTQIRNSPQTNQNVISYDCVISVDNKDLRLRPGMTATVSIVTAEQPDALRVPNTALRYRPPDAEGSKPDSALAAAGPGAGAAPGGRGGPGGPGGGGGQRGAGNGGGPNRGGRGMRTIYLLADNQTGKGKTAKPVQVRTGISDGVYTEIVDGVNEGDNVITSQSGGSAASSTATPAPSNPFGGQRRF